MRIELAQGWEELEGFEKSRLKALLEHLGRIEDPREPWRVLFPLREVLFLVICGTICDCDDYDLIADWGEAHLAFLRRYLPYENGVPGGRWLTILMNRINPALFSATFTCFVRATWPDRPDFVAIDGKTSRRSHDRAAGKEPLHLVSAFATTARLVLGQEAVSGKSNETTAIPARGACAWRRRPAHSVARRALAPPDDGSEAMAMADADQQKSAPGRNEKSAPPRRAERLAAALRENLRRRKAQARGRRPAADGETC